MGDEIKNTNRRVDRSAIGKFHVFWRGQLVCVNGKVREFETERDASEYLNRCDAAGRVLE
jgi:hypothetical protein